MTAFQRKVALRVLGIHVGVILFLMMISGMKGCFRPKPRPEIVTFIEFGQAAPPVSVEQVTQMTEPEPQPAPQPDPEPAPLADPVKKPIPQPTPKKVIPKPTPKPKETPKPKKKLVKAKDIKIGPKVEAPKPVKPAVSATDIKKALKSVQSSSSTVSKPTTTGPVGNPNADNAYISQIGSFFDQRWTKPDSSSPSASAVVRIYISQWGTITRRTKIQGSGDSAFDASVMSAVNSVSTVPKPPSGFSYEYVEVEFRVRN